MDDFVLQFIWNQEKITDDLFLKSRITDLLRQKEIRFPGAQPVSIEPRRDLSRVINEDFWVCEKTDGTRFLFYFDLSLEDQKYQNVTFEQLQDYTKQNAKISVSGYFIDREYQFFRVMVKKLYIQDVLPFIDNKIENFCSLKFLIDGEIVTDNIQNQAQSLQPNEKELRFYIFDCLYFGNKSLLNEPFTKRRKMGEGAGSIIRYCNYYLNKEAQKIDDPNNFGIIKFKSKQFEPKTNIQAIINLQKQLLHQSDGIIFTSERAPYILGTNNSILKWKPKHDNTVDLAVQFRTENLLIQQSQQQPAQQQQIYQIYFYNSKNGVTDYRNPVEHGIQIIEKAKFDNLQKKLRDSPDNCLILEVYWDETKQSKQLVQAGQQNNQPTYKIVDSQGQWAAKKIRVDKSIPNDKKVFDGVLRAYSEFIDIGDVIKVISGEQQIVGVCRQVNPFVRKKLGNIAETEEKYE